jgi:hypothetical protein
MNSDPLNGPLEVGLRALAILASAFPQPYDIMTLSFLDYSLLHSDEFGGPVSLHPPVPNHESEIAVKPDLLELGLHVMIRANLVTLRAEQRGIAYAATDDAPGFVDLLESDYMLSLRDRASWVIETFGDVEPSEVRYRLAQLAGRPANVPAALPDGEVG